MAPACSSACAPASRRSSTWSASCTARRARLNDSARFRAHARRAAAGDRRRLPRRGVKRLLHMSALGAAGRAVGIPALQGHRRESACSPPTTSTSPCSALRWSSGRRTASSTRSRRRALSAGVRRALSARRSFQPVYVGDVARAHASTRSRSPTAPRQGLRACAARDMYTLKELVQFVCAVTGRRRLVFGLPDAPVPLQAWMLEHLPGQLMTRDNMRSMQVPNACARRAFPFGLSPQSLEAVAPAYLAPPVRASATRSFAGARAASRCDRGAARRPAARRQHRPRRLRARPRRERRARRAGRLVAAVRFAHLNGLEARAAAIERANAEALARILAAEPVLDRCAPRGRADPGARRRAPDAACRPAARMGRACAARCAARSAARSCSKAGRAISPTAQKLAEAGARAVRAEPPLRRRRPDDRHHHAQPAAAGRARTRPFGNRALCTINEGLGKVMRFGGNDAEVLARLAWLRDELGPLLGQAFAARGGIALKSADCPRPDDGRRDAPAQCRVQLAAAARAGAALARTPHEQALARASSFIGGNDQFFLNVAMAMGKSITDPARRHRRLDHRHGDVPQRHRLRHSCRRARATAGSPRRSRCRQGSTSPAQRGRRESRTWATRRSWKRSAWAPLRWRRRRPSPDSWAPAASRGGRDSRARWARSPRTQSAMADPGARVRRHADRHRHPPRGGERHRARHQHRHRAQARRRRPGRRRRRPRAARLLRAGADGLCRCSSEPGRARRATWTRWR